MNKTYHILIIDDDTDFLAILSDKIKSSRGYETETAENGKSGYEKAKEFRPDLVIMDVKMPTMDGVESMMKIKEDPLLRSTKVVFLTAFGENHPEIYKNDRRFAQEIGAFEYLLKSEDLDKLVSDIDRFLGVGKE